MFKPLFYRCCFQHEQQIHRPFWREHNCHNKIYSRKSFFGKQTLILLFYQMSIFSDSGNPCENWMFNKYFSQKFKNVPFNFHIGDNFSLLCFIILRKSHIMLQKFLPSRKLPIFSYIFANNFQEMQKMEFRENSATLFFVYAIVETIMLVYDKNRNSIWIQRILSLRTFILLTPFFISWRLIRHSMFLLHVHSLP